MKCLLFIALMALNFSARSQSSDSSFPVRGFCIGSPRPAEVARFVDFIRQELVPRTINVLVLRVDFNYQYKTHPELRDSIALSAEAVNNLVRDCRYVGIQLIPQINLLGHQSWASTTYNLLKVYPQFDETPWVKMPAKYEWPN